MSQQDDPFAAFGGSAISAPPEPQSPSPSHADDPFAAFGGSALPDHPANQPAQQQSAAAPTDPFSAFGGHAISAPDPFAAFGGKAIATPANAPQAPTNADKPWYERAWDIANTPLVNLKRDGAKGVEAGVEDVASSFTSPLSIALTAATFGTAPLLEGLGINVAKMAAPELISAAKTAGKLASVGFTGMQLKGIADSTPAFTQAIENGDTDKALEIGVTMLAQGGFAALGARSAYHDIAGNTPEQFTSTDKLIGHYQRMLKEDTEQARNFNIDFKKSVPDQGTRNAIQFFAEAGGDSQKLADWQNRVDTSDTIKPALKSQVSDALQKAQSLSDSEIAHVAKLREWYDTDFNEAVGKDLLSTESRKTDYAARARWTNEPDNDVDNARTQLGQSSQPDHTKHRIFQTTVDGILTGYEPVKSGSRYALDAADVAADYHRQLGAEIAKREFVERALSARAEDGRPFAVQSGSGNALESGPTITNSLTIPDKLLRNDEVEALKQTGDLPKLMQTGNVYQDANGKFRFDTSHYVNDIRSPHTNGYSYGGSPDVIVKGPVAFHPDVADVARTILAPERSAIREIPGVDTALKVSSFAKHTLLGGSAFHWVQEGLRGIESGVNPLHLESWDMSNPEHVRLIEAGGLQPGLDSAAASFTEGLSGGDGALSKIPGVGAVINKSNQALFGPGGFIDRLKLTTGLKFADRLKSDPNMDTMTRFKVAGQMANARFGGLNYLAMGRSKEAQDIMRLTLLAPDWIESQIRDTGFALQYPRVGAADLARIALFNFGASRVLNMMVSGNPHLEEPFGVVSDDGKKVYSVRTMPGDIYHAVTDPMNFAANRMNPLTLRTGVEAVTGRDKLGHKRDMREQLVDLFKNITPIPLQGVEDRLTGNMKPNASWSDSAASAAGVTTRPNYSPAEALAMRLNSDSAGTGSLPSESLARHHRVVQLEDRLRSGDQSAMVDMQSMVQGGLLASQDAKVIMTTSKTPRLVSSIRSLPMSSTLDVWDKATNQERQQLTPVMLHKIAAFRKTEVTKLTPVERDRMNVRLAKVYNDLTATAQSAGQ